MAFLALLVVCVQFMFGKTSLASSYYYFKIIFFIFGLRYKLLLLGRIEVLRT